MSVVWDDTSSPCKGCGNVEENKKTFEECINCEKRHGKATHFLPDRGKKRGIAKRKGAKKPCQWPHGCQESSHTSDYCTEHQRLRQDRKRKLPNKGAGIEEYGLERILNAPIRKGPNKDSLKAMHKWDNML